MQVLKDCAPEGPKVTAVVNLLSQVALYSLNVVKLLKLCSSCLH